MDDDVAAPFASTAYWIAAVRAKESARPDRLFEDPHAEALAGSLGVEVLARSERATGGENPYLPVRTRFVDDVLTIDGASCRQVVLLGAGFDTRAFRLPLAAGVRYFEIDRPDVFERKESVLAASGARPSCLRVIVRADLSGEWSGRLLSMGFDLDLPTAWVAEGLFFYLTQAAVLRLLRLTRRLSGPGSLLVADIFGTGILDSPGMPAYLESVARRGLPMPFCADSPAALFEASGWERVEIVEPGQSRANFGRLGADGWHPGRPAGSTTRTWLVVGHAPAAG